VIESNFEEDGSEEDGEEEYGADTEISQPARMSATDKMQQRVRAIFFSGELCVCVCVCVCV
jgi:hypothetical protein